MHEQEISHRDLKPENILLKTPTDKNGVKIVDPLAQTVKICDLGAAKVLDKPKEG